MKPKKDCVINMRVKSRDLALIDMAASVKGVTRSEFLRFYAEQEALRVLSTPRLVCAPTRKG